MSDQQPEPVDAVFAALSDSTRREVLARLSTSDSCTATQLASDLPVTRQAVAKHLAALRDANLVTAQRHGRETRYQLTPEPLGTAMAWMAAVGAEWDQRLHRLAAMFDGDARPG